MRETTHYPLMKRPHLRLSHGYDHEMMKMHVQMWLRDWARNVSSPDEFDLIEGLLGDIDGPVLERKA